VSRLVAAAAMWRLVGWRERKEVGYTARAPGRGLAGSGADEDASSLNSPFSLQHPSMDFFNRQLSGGQRSARRIGQVSPGSVGQPRLHREISDDTLVSIGAEGLAKTQAPPGLRKHRQAVQRLALRDAPAFQTRNLFNVMKRKETRMPFVNDIYHVFMQFHLMQIICIFWVLYILMFAVFGLLWMSLSEDCDVGVHTFWQAYCFSIETQMSVGFGTDDSYFNDCLGVAWVMPTQMLIGGVLDCCLLGTVFQIASRARNRAFTIVFSDTAVLQVTGEEVSLVFRVAEMSSRPLLQARMQVYCVQHHEDASSPGGIRVEVAALALEKRSIAADARTGVIFFGLPTQVAHRIDSASPLAPPGKAAAVTGSPRVDRNPRPDEVRRWLRRRPYLEVVVLVSGIEDTSASSVEARHSYTLDDIFWDRMFVPCVSVDHKGRHSVDFEALHETMPASWSQVAQSDMRVTMRPVPRGSADATVQLPSFL